MFLWYFVQILLIISLFVFLIFFRVLAFIMWILKGKEQKEKFTALVLVLFMPLVFLTLVIHLIWKTMMLMSWPEDLFIMLLTETLTLVALLEVMNDIQMLAHNLSYAQSFRCFSIRLYIISFSQLMINVGFFISQFTT